MSVRESATMSNAITRGVAALAIAAAATCGLSACGGDDENSSREVISSTGSTSSDVDSSDIPTAAELTEILQRASDSNIPVEEKTQLVQGGEQAPEIFEQIAEVRKQNGAEIEIASVVAGDFPGTAIGSAVIRQPGQQDIFVEAQFINDNGRWKLEKSFACALITNAGLTAPETCPQQ